MPYGDQLALKQRSMEDLFADWAPQGAVRPILGMDDPFHYRNKVTSPFAPGRRIDPAESRGRGGRAYGRDGRTAGKGKAARAATPRHEILTGMYAAHSHRLVPTDACLLENQQAKAVIAAVRDLMPRFGLLPYREDAHAGFVRHAVVRVGHESGEVLVTLVTNGKEFPGSRAFCRELVRRCPFVTTVVQNVNLRQTNVILGEEERTLYGPGFILDTLCGLSFRISSHSFYQVNAVQTEVLYRQAMELAGLDGHADGRGRVLRHGHHRPGGRKERRRARDRCGQRGVGCARRAPERPSQRRGECGVRRCRRWRLHVRPGRSKKRLHARACCRHGGRPRAISRRRRCEREGPRP